MIGVLPNKKGGVGKTINVLNLGAGLSNMGYKTLIIDFDDQCDLTYSAGIKGDFYTVVDFLEGKSNLDFRQRADNLFILPGSDDFTSTIYKKSALKEALFKKYPNGNCVNDFFDFIFIDCPPSRINLKLKNRNLGYSEIELALIASDFFLIPLEADEFSVKNANKFLGKVSKFKNQNNLNLKFLGFFFGIILMTENSKDYYTNIFKSSNSNFLFDSFIRKDVQVKKSIQRGLTIFQHDPNCRAANDYTELTKEFLIRIDNVK